jgi:hypothetical protein
MSDESSRGTCGDEPERGLKLLVYEALRLQELVYEALSYRRRAGA